MQAQALRTALSSITMRNAELERDTAQWAEQVREAQQAVADERQQRDSAETALAQQLADLKWKVEQSERAARDSTRQQGDVGPEDGLPPMRVFVYDMPARFNRALHQRNPQCRHDAGNTWQTKYTAEVYIHEQLLRSPLRTTNPEEADLFYVPVYYACYLHTHSTNFLLGHAMLQEAIDWVRQAGPHWNRTQGADHVLVLTHDLGGCVAPFLPLRHAILVTNTGELMNRKDAMDAYTTLYSQNYKFLRDFSMPCFSPWKDVVVPPMITDKLLLSARGGAGELERAPRPTLATFRGTVLSGGPWDKYSRGVRQLWLKRYGEHDPNVQLTVVMPDTSGNKEYEEEYYRDFTRSKFCLCPPGWATWTPRMYESMLAGCIPVVVADGNALPFARMTDYSQVAVHVPESQAGEVGQLLLRVPAARVAAIQANIRRVWRRFVYTLPNAQPGDAFYFLMHELYHRARTLPARNQQPLEAAGLDKLLKYT